ncbi:MAG: hypothetical protein FWF59_07105 [Turicibacter sp.]|nr:hypothetical protein [Turicibacter sp.]
MNYAINKDGFRLREENSDTCSVMNLATQQISFHQGLAALILRSHDITDSFSMAAKAGKNQDKAQKFEELEAMVKEEIGRLSHLGLAVINDLPRPENGPKVAGELDYETVAAFIAKNISNDEVLKYGVGTFNFYSAAMIRGRQMNNLEYNFLSASDGEVVAAIAVGSPVHHVPTATLTINMLFCPDDRNVLIELLRFVKEATRGEFRRLRFNYASIYSEKTLGLLTGIGFQKVAVLEGEIKTHGGRSFADLEIYDLEFSEL